MGPAQKLPFHGGSTRRPTVHSLNADFSDTRYRHAEEAEEREKKITQPLCIWKKDGLKLWRLTKQLSDEGNSTAKITLEENRKFVTGKQAAETFAEICMLQSREKQEERCGKEQPASRTTVKSMQQLLRLAELQRAPKKMKPRKSLRPNDITNEMHIHFGSAEVVQTPADPQSQLGTMGASTDMSRSNYDLHAEEREGPKESKQLSTS